MSASEAMGIIDALRDGANKLLSSTLQGKLVSYQSGNQGMFPYTLTTSASTYLNGLTYDWISSGVTPRKAADGAVQLDGVFTTRYTQLWNSIDWMMSAEDEQRYNQAQANARDEGTQLWQTYNASVGGTPKADGSGNWPVISGNNPITQATAIILGQWASPPLPSLEPIISSPNPVALFNKAPFGADQVIPKLVQYLSATQGTLNLTNAQTQASFLRNQIKLNVQQPSDKNGGIQTTSSNGQYVPNYQVNQSYEQIKATLGNTGSEVKLQATVKRADSSHFSVNVSGSAGFVIPFASFFTLGFGGSANYFKEEITSSSESIDMTFRFQGVGSVTFGPKNFLPSSSPTQYWYDPDPIREAAKFAAAGDTNINNLKNTGWHFTSSTPPDVSALSSNGYVNLIAVSKAPIVEIVVHGERAKQINEKFQQQTSTSVSFLGINLGFGVKESTSSSKSHYDASSQTTTITITPPPEPADTASQAKWRAWILGCQSSFPGEQTN